MRPTLALIVLGCALTWSARTAQPNVDATDLAYREVPGSVVPMQLTFVAAQDQRVTLAQVANGKPLILVPAYYDCTSLCGLVRSSLFGALAGVGAGGYAVAIVSIDPDEHSDSARMAREHDRAALAKVPGLEPAYLTGTDGSIRAVTQAVGFRARRDPASGQFLHPAGVVFVTPGGTVSGYLLGVGYTASQVRAALDRARAGRLAAIGAPLLLLCFHFDPVTGRYSLEIIKALQLAGVLTCLVVGALVFLMLRRERA